MQRFKKYAMKKGNVDVRLQPRIFGTKYGFGSVLGAGRYGKFVYGTNGTLTQAARWRIQAIRALRNARFGYEMDLETPFRYLAEYTRESVSKLMTSSRASGCVLP